VTESGYNGMLCLADHSMHLYFLRIHSTTPPAAVTGAEPAYSAPRAVVRRPVRPDHSGRPGKLFSDSEAGKLQGATAYETVCGTIPLEWGAGGDMALDCTEEYASFGWARRKAAKHLAPDTKLEAALRSAQNGRRPDRPRQHES